MLSDFEPSYKKRCELNNKLRRPLLSGGICINPHRRQKYENGPGFDDLLGFITLNRMRRDPVATEQITLNVHDVT